MPIDKKQTCLSQDKALQEWWQEVETQFAPIYRNREPTYILSPAQARRYQLCQLRVPKFKYIGDMAAAGYKFVSVPADLFNRFFKEWAGLGLIEMASLEQKYIDMLPPAFMEIKPMSEVISLLDQLIKKQELSAKFCKLWTEFITSQAIANYIDIMQPYIAAEKSAEENDSSVVERYIYALWMYKQGYRGKRGERDRLITELAMILTTVIEKLEQEKKNPWYLMYYRGILSKQSDRRLTTTVTNMSANTIEEYATYGDFSLDDFPELSSQT